MSSRSTTSSSFDWKAVEESDPTPTDRPLLLIPGPIEYESSVMQTLSLPSLSHVSPTFINEFKECLADLRTILGVSPSSQVYVLSGSGTLGWDVILSNLVERGQSVLVINTGYFSDSFAACAETYGIVVHQLRCPIGSVVSTSSISEWFDEHPHVGQSLSMVLVTHVDTSTAVLNDVCAISKIVKLKNPNVMVAVDGVCSFGGEDFQMDDWRIDACHTCSQKALGAPPGLAIVAMSERALSIHSARKTPVPAYFASLTHWTPIMKSYESSSPSYFATPNVNLVRALRVSCRRIVSQLLSYRIRLTKWRSTQFKSAMESMGLRQLPTDAHHRAHTLSAFYFPEGDTSFDSKTFMASVSTSGVTIAGGLHKDIKTRYFRVGHMGLSTYPHRTDLEKAVEAIEGALIASGQKGIVKGEAIKVFRGIGLDEQQMQ